MAAGKRHGCTLHALWKAHGCMITFGMTGRSANLKGSMELGVPTEKFYLISADEKQNENGENLLLMPCYLKPGHGLIVCFDGAAQIPPHLPGLCDLQH